jgi:cold shock CspA family protein
MQKNGTIKYANSEKRYGFITPAIAGCDIYFSFDQLRGSAARSPIKGEAVIYEEGMGKRGPVATTVYNLADPLAVEDHTADQETAQRLAVHKQAANEGRKAFTAALLERNKQWHAARMPSPAQRD